MKKRGRYMQYYTDLTLPIPASTARDLAARANREENEEPPAVQDEDGVGEEDRSRSSLSSNSDHDNCAENLSASDENEHIQQSEDDDDAASFDSGHSEVPQDNDNDEPPEGEEDIGADDAAGPGGNPPDPGDPESDPESGFDDDDEDDLHRDEEEVNNAEDNGNNRRDVMYLGEVGKDCPITFNEGTLLVMAFSLRFGLSDLAMESLLQLLNCHMPVDAYGSFHSFQQEMPQPPIVNRKYYCPQEKCRRPVVFEADENVFQCQCQNECRKNELNKLSSFYLALPLKDQLVSLLKNQDVYSKLRWRDMSESDVISGRFYQDLIHRRTIRVGQDLTIQFNTDGAQIFKSSSQSVWPIQVMINELPYKQRKESIILCGLWYGCKPNMNTFLESFIEELTSLHREGFQLHIPGYPPRNMKVHTILCSVDSAARPAMQGLKSFSGYYGCSFCLHDGDYLPVGRGAAVLYTGDMGPLRTRRQHLADTAEYNLEPRGRLYHKNGVQGTAALLVLPVFDVIDSFVPDYLHAVLLGVVKTFVEYWTSEAGEFYIGNNEKITEIDSVMLTIKPPCEITRAPRSFTARYLWRGHEWKNFLLYYSLPCLKAVNFPAKYLNHWFLLVYGISCFLKDRITEDDHREGTDALRKFVLDITEVYQSHVLMKFNVHLLLHIPKAVTDFGALWAWSTFKYEAYNGFLGKMFKSSQSAQLQICKNYVRFQSLTHKLAEMYNADNFPRSVRKVLKTMAHGRTTRHVYVANANLNLLGVPLIGSLSLIQLNVVQNLLPNTPLQIHNVRFYRRFIYKHVLHHGRLLEKRNNSVVKIDGPNNEFVRITNAVLIHTAEDNPRTLCIILGFKLRPTGGLLCSPREVRINSSKFSTVVEETQECVALLPRMLGRKCVLTFFPGDPRKFCCFPLPNLHERD